MERSPPRRPARGISFDRQQVHSISFTGRFSLESVSHSGRVCGFESRSRHPQEEYSLRFRSGSRRSESPPSATPKRTVFIEALHPPANPQGGEPVVLACTRDSACSETTLAKV